ncbi:hypothetical protein K7I13_13620 [Brucepastera parasyntrophica]|uniref:hypothetical protein n=1 Tax=Brucepastera parasyntrophica TaxID=2880008 RepID=UPI00210C5EB4|nr:hypothetical protein [Brucepastera parasyntrophica]ULQ59493.1 hypothetical protein K7I13_13620 [Brucepastera parasyntrophica]
MKKTPLLLLLLLCLSAEVFAQAPVLSGLLDTKLTLAGGSDPSEIRFGAEEYANLRLKVNVGERASVFTSFNLTAAAGSTALVASMLNNSPAHSLPLTAFSGGENYIAALELERLYFRINSELLDVEAGLMRLAFGYGQVWGPSDFLNPRNPLHPDARPRAILGSSVSLYPSDTSKIQAFAAAPKNAFEQDGNGALFGLSGDKHWDRASVQLLYTYEIPKAETPDGLHYAGLSVKAEVELGLTAEVFYMYDNRDRAGFDGIAASAGFDYSFFDGSLYILAEYFFSGKKSFSSAVYEKRNYLYAMLMYRFNDYTNASLSCVAGLDDISFSPVIGFEHDLFQGATLSFTGRVPLDRDTFSGNEKHGELGPDSTDTSFEITAKLRMRF